jgi:hypothetical protein
LVPIFGIYFAVRLFHAGDTPQRFGRPLLLAISGLVLKLAGTFVMESHAMTYVSRLSMNFIVTLIAFVLCAMAWRTLCKVLLAYGYLSRIPVAIVQYLAMRGRWRHTLRCVRSRISSHRLLANLSPRFLRPEHLFHGGLYGDCGCTSRLRRCIRARAGQTRSTGDSSSGTSIEGEQHGLTHVESAIDSKPSGSVRV